MEEKEPIIFSLDLVGMETPGGIDFKVRMVNTGVPEEIVMTKIKMWLKGAEQAYFEYFKKDFA